MGGYKKEIVQVGIIRLTLNWDPVKLVFVAAPALLLAT
jgi:hypothetical protein